MLARHIVNMHSPAIRAKLQQSCYRHLLSCLSSNTYCHFKSSSQFASKFLFKWRGFSASLFQLNVSRPSHLNSLQLTFQFHRAHFRYYSSLARNPAMADKPRALSVNDPTSFSNPEEVRADRINIRWDVDFEKKILDGAVNYELVVNRPDVTKIIFDVRDLHIKAVKDSKGQNLPYEIGASYMTMGKPLTVNLPSFAANAEGELRCEITIEYETDPKTSALQWLAKEMTAERKFPFLYSHSEAIHARALFPCQDTPFTKAAYTAAVTAPKESVVLFSAVSTAAPEDVDETRRLHKYEQKVPVPSYLIAFAVGQLESGKIGPRSNVWAEKSLLNDAQYDFSEAEQMIQAAQSIVGDYVWGRYDVLVLPPSFPFGGMENPCLTFATPTLLTHDKSLANVIAHEIAHSWTGNLVTNINFEHFWLNEGFTVFLERKILGILRGEPERQFASIEGWTTLVETVDTLGKDNPMTKLVLDLKGVDPDDSFSSIPYEKGYVFLYYLETVVGGASEMNGFLRQYVQKFQYKSIDSFQFKQNFIEYFEAAGKGDALKAIDWDTWFFASGLPPVKPNYDTSLYDACASLSRRWINWNPQTPSTFSLDDLKEFSPTQVQEFLASLLASEKPLDIQTVKTIEQTYKFNTYRNAEIRFRWLRICIKSRWRDQLPSILQFVTDVGRMKFIRPIYRDLYNWEDVRAEAIATFKKNRPYMMYVSAYTVAKDLHIDS